MAARVEITKQNDRCLLTVSGVIDESFDHGFVKSVPKGLPLIIDLKGATRINSMGMLSWRSLMRELGTVTDKIYIAQCSTMMVSQTSTILGFMGRAIILSVCVPYACDACGHTIEVVRKTSELDLSASMACEKCGKAMVLDEAPEIFQQIPPNNLPAEAQPQRELRR